MLREDRNLTKITGVEAAFICDGTHDRAGPNLLTLTHRDLVHSHFFTCAIREPRGLFAAETLVQATGIGLAVIPAAASIIATIVASDGVFLQQEFVTRLRLGCESSSNICQRCFVLLGVGVDQATE